MADLGEDESKAADVQSSTVQDVAPEVVDDKKIETAVKFLQNPKVRQTSFSNRIAFLRRKGLNDKEIEIAIDQSGTKQDKDVKFKLPATDNPPGTVAIHRDAVGPPTQQRSFLEYVSSIVVSGGIVYAAIYVVQKYVIPYLYGKEEEEFEKLGKNLAELSHGVKSLGLEMKTTLKALEEQIIKQQNVLSNVSAELVVTKAKVELVPSDATSLSDVKSEIASVKGLLLGRNQFPTTPFAPSSTSPSIPAWQKVSTRKKAEDVRVEDRKNTSPTGAKSQEDGIHRITQHEKDAVSSILNACDSVSKQSDIDITPGESSKDDSRLNDSLLSDQEVAGLMENSSDALSSTYVKLGQATENV